MMVEIVKTRDGLQKVLLKEPRGSTAQVHLYGGQVTSWKNDRGEELLFLSSKALFKPPKAIRGGIPIFFPQQHGFVRNRFWSIDPNPPPLSPRRSNSNVGSEGISGNAVINLLYKPNADDLRIWPHRFELRLRVALGSSGDLTITLRVRNTDNKPFTFTLALHDYLPVSDISEVRIEGLETIDYLDNLQRGKRFTEQGDALTFDEEVDRIYLDTPTKLAIIDHEKKRTYVLKKEGLPDAGVWNPWEKKSNGLTDLGEEEYKHMLCIESAAVEHPITLKPGEEWKGRQEITAVSSSYFSGQLDPSNVLNG